MKRTISRRAFVAGATAGATSLLALRPGSAAAEAASSGAKSQARTDPPHARFSELPLSAIEPQGWLKAYLKKQKEGLTGNLDRTGGFPFNTFGWGGPGLSDVPAEWWSYEQTAYWVDGMVRCGHLLRDRDLIDKARKQIDYVLDHPDEDGYLGPKYLKHESRWPHVVFFRALFAQSSATGDVRIPAAINRHFLSSPYPHSAPREACAIEAMLWTYERGGDPALLEMAKEVYRRYEASDAKFNISPAMFTDGRPCHAHGVSYNELAKLGAMLYMHTGNPGYLKVSTEAYKKIDKYHMLVDGVNSSTELMREVDPLESHETCNISDYSWTVGYLLMATGQTEYSDKIERACFNAAPGAVSEDFTALQYFSCPNQVIAANNTNHNLYYRGDRTMAFGTAHLAACCSGNVNRVMPNFTARMWMKDGNNGLVATLYGPSKVTHRVGKRQQEVTITEQTRYPFSDRIVFALSMTQDTKFPFTVRIPGWCKAAKIMVNQETLDQDLSPGTFVTIDRKFSDQDEVVVILPQETKITSWPMDGIAVERGPLVYSLQIEEEWQSLDDVAEAVRQAVGIYFLPFRYPGLLAHNVYPKSPWNYALDLDPRHASQIQVMEMDWPDDHPWSRSAPPVLLKVPARRVAGWALDEPKEITQQGEWYHPQQLFTRHGDFAFTPQLPVASSMNLETATETVTLVPYGCAKLRLTIFPRVPKAT